MNNYEYAIQCAKNDNITAIAWGEVNAEIPKLLELLQPFRRFKRLNSTHCDAISKLMDKSPRSGLYYVYLTKRQFFEGQYEFVIVLSHLNAEGWREPSLQRDTYRVPLSAQDLSGEAVYQGVKSLKLYQPDEHDINEVIAFYKRYEEFLQKEPLSKYCLQTLNSRY